MACKSKNLLFLPSLILLCGFLMACSAVKVPQVGAAAPCEIQSVAQVEKAVQAGLNEYHWKILSNSMHAIQAQKTVKQLQATIEIAYGYRGFSIEYLDSQGLNYNVDDDTIDPAYKKWVYVLMETIKERLEKQAASNPDIKCFNQDAES